MEHFTKFIGEPRDLDCSSALPHLQSHTAMPTDYHRDHKGELPSRFEDVAEHSVLMAHFWLARQMSRLILREKQDTAKALDDS